MNCDNCGAAMRAVSGGSQFVCEYCRAIQFAPSGRGDDRIHFTEDADARSCPLCRELLSVGFLDGLPAAACATCRGFLMTNDNFGKLVRLRRATGRESDAAVRAIDPVDLRRSLDCPGCGGRMETHPYYGPGRVVIDNCPRCGLIWLDAGELKTIEQAPGRR
jgi:Zn-finger nucleic acid-binding protein